MLLVFKKFEARRMNASCWCLSAIYCLYSMKKSEPDPILSNNIIIDVVVDDTSWYTLPFDCKDHAEEILYAVLDKLNISKGGAPLEISLLLANNARLQALNLDFRSIDKPTNVLSFPYAEVQPSNLEEALSVEEAIYLGDIAISYETIAQEANDQDKTFKNHLTHMIIHGLLHLLGYDHIDDEEREFMESLEIEILRDKFNISNPYII